MKDFRQRLKLHVNHDNLGLDVIRVFLGVALFIRGALFISNQEPLMELVEVAGVDWILPIVAVHYVALAHLAGGLLMVFGLLTRWAALVQIPVLIGAVFLIHLSDGLLATGQSLELAVLVLFLLCIFFVYGSGVLSMDYFIFERSVEAEVVPKTMETVARVIQRRVPSKPLSETRTHVEKYPGVCSCGHGKDDFWVSPEPHYSAVANSLGVLFGVSGGPISIRYRCRKCDEIVAESTDPQVIEEVMRRA